MSKPAPTHTPPETGPVPVGYAHLINSYGLEVPAPFSLSAVGTKHRMREVAGWRYFTPRHSPESSLAGHLTFALRYEGVDLGVLNALFAQVGPTEIEGIVRNEPTGRYARRIWFLYEFLTDRLLDVPNTSRQRYVDLLDPKIQYAAPPRPSKRHCVNNNLPGVRAFCPLVRRTAKLDALIEKDLAGQALDITGEIHRGVLMRAASFLLLKDSQASYAIEGETPPQNRAGRWGRVIGQAGQKPLSRAEFERLQREVIVDSRFIRLGYRNEGGFVGDRDRATQMPVPDHVSAKPLDLEPLMEGLVETASLLGQGGYPPVLAAAAVGFGFVFIHPFEDGNGRIHRYLLHHVLAETGFAPKGLVFPVSAAILERIDGYREALEAYSRPRLLLVDWRATGKGNVEVLNETVDLYRYFDATRQTEFLYECVDDTVTRILPDEIEFLRCYDEMKAFIAGRFDMPDRMSSLLVNFLHQNGGSLSKRACEGEFSALSKEEVRTLEGKYIEIFRN